MNKHTNQQTSVYDINYDILIKGQSIEVKCINNSVYYLFVMYPGFTCGSSNKYLCCY